MTSPKLDDILVKSGLARFTRNIKLGKFARSYDVARRTVKILNRMVKENDWKSGKDLMTCLKGVCLYLDGLDLVETTAGNMTRRAMRIVRDECQQEYQVKTLTSVPVTKTQQQDEPSTLESITEINDQCLDIELNSSGLNQEQTDEDGEGSAKKSSNILENIVEAIEQELMNELELSSSSIANQATDYVQSDDVILTLGKSEVIENFLKHASNGGKTGKRKFSVVVVELAPFFSGREMAKSLIEHGISTLIIPDSAVFAIMSRVNKVIISTHSMMANGGIKAPAGSHSIALAAKHYSVPLIVCCPMYKLTPEYLVSHDMDAFKKFSNLHTAFPEAYTSKRLRDDETADNMGSNASVESLHSIFDYVPPELITLFVSNIGGHSPSYVYQLLNELYHKPDYLD